ncbi:enhancer of split m5 protein-like [Musca vetustissima]|uniref:enhancer of split m5 protein-like n=1 Tax=Musca vetustissima TaxID=27455 RepID=UPI002AB7CBB4|nr:enhancer of split m5 protein-like [Musca vetustissima]
MAPQMEFVSKTQHYLKVKKPQLERERRARINKCLDTLKVLVADLQGNGNILRMDKTEMLESVVSYMKTQVRKSKVPATPIVPMDSFRHGYMNAVNEVSRVMAATPGINVQLGKAVMTHLGCAYNRLSASPVAPVQKCEERDIYSAAPMSPASSGYHSDEESSPSTSPAPASLWRPW